MVGDPLKLVGERLKSARLERGLTARGLAEAGGIAFNTVSLIERGKISPTVATLHKLATALQVPLTFFFEDASAHEVVFLKRGQRQKAEGARVKLEGLGAGLRDQTMEPLLLTLEPDGDSGPEPMVHLGHELVFCLEGCLEYQVRDEIYRLEPEDSLLFEARLPHRWRNVQNTPTRALLVIQAAQGSEEARRQHSEGTVPAMAKAVADGHCGDGPREAVSISGSEGTTQRPK